MPVRIFPLAVLTLAAILPAQQTTATLTAFVTDHKGTPVPSLTQTDFVVHVNGQPVPISDFKAFAPSNTPSVETILVVDAVNTRTTSVAYERTQISKFLRLNGGHLAQPTSIFLVTDTSVRTLPQSTRDGNGLADALDKAETGLREFRNGQGFYSAVEQFQISARALQQITRYQATRPGPKLLLWISPGWPLLSGPEIDLSKKDQQRFFNELVALTDQLRAAHITLTSIDPLGTADAVSYRTTFYQVFTKPVPNPRKMNLGNLALQVLATQSGGRVLNGNNDTSALIRQAASDAETFYTFTVPLSEVTLSDDNPAGFHAIAASVEPRGLTVRTPTVIYTGPAPETATPPSVPPPNTP